MARFKKDAAAQKALANTVTRISCCGGPSVATRPTANNGLGLSVAFALGELEKIELVATMNVHGIRRLLTFNIDEFARLTSRPVTTAAKNTATRLPKKNQPPGARTPFPLPGRPNPACYREIEGPAGPTAPHQMPITRKLRPPIFMRHYATICNTPGVCVSRAIPNNPPLLTNPPADAAQNSRLRLETPLSASNQITSAKLGLFGQRTNHPRASPPRPLAPRPRPRNQTAPREY
jgi:hypothetical protein